MYIIFRQKGRLINIFSNIFGTFSKLVKIKYSDSDMVLFEKARHGMENALHSKKVNITKAKKAKKKYGK